MTVSNIGSASVGFVTVVDTLPTELTATDISGTGWSCTLLTLICTRSDVLTTSYPAITVTVNVSGNAGASITNTASVSGGGETNTSNDIATDVTTVLPPPDLTISKSHTGNFTQGQVGATYTLTVSNTTGVQHQWHCDRHRHTASPIYCHRHQRYGLELRALDSDLYS